MEKFSGELTYSLHCVWDFHSGRLHVQSIILFEGEGDVNCLASDFYGLFIISTRSMVCTPSLFVFVLRL